MKQLRETPKKERHATWLELFYDLIFVVAVSKVTHTLSHTHHGHITPGMYGKYVLMFVPVWWAWVGHTLFADRFRADDARHRLLTLLQMFLVVLLSVFIDPDFNANFLGFTLSYVAIRGVLILMYWRGIQLLPEKAEIGRYFIRYFSLGALISLSSLLFPGDIRYAVLYLGVGIDLMVPILGRRKLERYEVHNEHLPERFGLFTIIVLGESVLSISAAVEDLSWTASSVAIAASGFLLIACIWWIYFEILEKYIVKRSLASGQLVIYSHLFTYMGLGLIASFIMYSILRAGILFQDYRQLGIMGILLFMLPLEAIHLYCSKLHQVKKTAVAALLFVLLTCIPLIWLKSMAWVLPVLTTAFLVRAILLLISSHEEKSVVKYG